MINGERVRQARELLSLTQTSVARELSVNQSAIAQIESGRIQPSPAVALELARVLGAPRAFFERGDPPPLSIGSLAFRARASMTARQRLQAVRYAQVVIEGVMLLEEKVEARPVKLRPDAPDMRWRADTMRVLLGLSIDGPIENLTNAIEQIGVLVLAIPIRLARRDAFAFWFGVHTPRPVIVIPEAQAGDRLRFSVAHELAHLSHGIDLGIGSASLEHDADRYASELLLPARSIYDDFRRGVSLDSLASKKRRWGVSIQALLRRCFDLDMISERRYRYLAELIGKRGWRLREPPQFDVPIEKPRYFRKLAEVVYGLDPDTEQMAEDLRLTPRFVESLLSAHARAEDLRPITE